MWLNALPDPEKNSVCVYLIWRGHVYCMVMIFFVVHVNFWQTIIKKQRKNEINYLVSVCGGLRWASKKKLWISNLSKRIENKKKKQRIQKKTSEYICAVCLYMRPNSRVFAALRTKFTCEVFNLFKFMYNFVSNHWSSQRGNKLVTYTRTTQKKCFHEGNFYMPIETINLFQELLHSFVFFCPIANLNLPWVNM